MYGCAIILSGVVYLKDFFTKMLPGSFHRAVPEARERYSAFNLSYPAARPAGMKTEIG